MDQKYKHKKLFIKGYDYSVWSKNEESTNKEEYVDLSDMLPLEGDEEEVKEEKGLKSLNPNKWSNRLPILLA